jgi:hypothetical protein
MIWSNGAQRQNRAAAQALATQKQRAKPVLLAVRELVRVEVLLGRGGLILNGRWVSHAGGGANCLLGLVTVVVRLRS